MIIKSFPKKIMPFYPGILHEWRYFTIQQYKILDIAYKYEFPYQGYNQIKFMVPKFLYEAGWKCIKPVFCLYKEALFKHYDDDGEYVRNLNPLDIGTYFKPFMLEYTHEKKYNELDIYSKTNTYARYNLYNDIYYKDYKGEKFSTKSNFDFTDEEIKANFDNVVNNKTLVKYNHVIENEKNKRYLDEFTKMLTDYQQQRIQERGGLGRELYDMDVDEEVKAYWYLQLNDPKNILILPIIEAYIELYRPTGHYDFSFEDVFKGFYGYKSVRGEEDWIIDENAEPINNIYVYGDNGLGDNSFTDYKFPTKIEVKMLFYYELTVEYQESIVVSGLFYEYFSEDVIEEDYDYKEDILIAGIYIAASLIGSLAFILVFFNCNILFEHVVFFDSGDAIKKFNFLQDYYLSHKPKLHYELIQRKGRCTLPNKQLPPHLYDETNMIFIRQRGRKWLPFSLLDRITMAINNHDFLVRTAAYHLWNLGTKLGYR